MIVLLILSISGSNGILDLRKDRIIPKRLKNSIERMIKDMDLMFEYFIKKDESDFLKKIAKAENKEDLIAVSREINIENASNEFIFVSLGIQKL
jgi:hypothetical protein